MTIPTLLKDIKKRAIIVCMLEPVIGGNSKLFQGII